MFATRSAEASGQMHRNVQNETPKVVRLATSWPKSAERPLHRAQQVIRRCTVISAGPAVFIDIIGPWTLAKRQRTPR